MDIVRGMRRLALRIACALLRQVLVRLIQRGVPNSPIPESRGLFAAELVASMLAVNRDHDLLFLGDFCL